MSSVAAQQAHRAMRKIAPRGPLVRLAASAAQQAARGDAAKAGALFARDDWNTGRDVSAEERHCGLLLRLQDVLRKGGKAGPQPSDADRPPLEAVIKAQTSDFQCNEVDMRGSAAFLEKAPKGRWRKISRQATRLLENSATPFSDPAKTYNPAVVSHGEYVRRVGKLPKESPLLQFVMYRDGYAMESVLNRFRYEIGVEAAAVHFRGAGSGNPHSHRSAAPPGGSFGCFTQFGCCVGVTHEQLSHASRHYNLHPLLMDPRGYHPLDQLPDLTAPPWGYFYRILLRCVTGNTEADILAALRRLSQDGFINYFGVENFGLGATHLFEMAAMAAHSDFNAAVGGYFQSLAESSPLHHDHYLAYLNAEDSTTAALASSWAAACKAAKCTRAVQRAVDGLAHYHAKPQHRSGAAALSEEETDAATRELWECLDVEAAARRSAAKFVWNAMATQRLLAGGAARVLPGDVVVLPDHEGSHGGDGSAGGHRVVADKEEARRFSITDVVLPVPSASADANLTTLAAALGESSCVGLSLYRAFSRKHKLDFLFPPELPQRGAPSPSCDESIEYRHLVVKPSRLQAAVISDPSSLTALKSDLFVHQERKPLETLDLDFANRVREPSPFNVSERFAERMAAVRHRHTGSQSVALSFLLPAGASPLVALRESFNLKYPHFTDLYFTS